MKTARILITIGIFCALAMCGGCRHNAKPRPESALTPAGKHGAAKPSKSTLPCGMSITKAVFDVPGDRYLSAEELGEELMTQWLDRFVKNAGCGKDALLDYNITNVRGLGEKQGAMKIKITYDVRPVDEDNRWAGRAVPDVRNWVRNKSEVLDVALSGGMYKITGAQSAP